MQQVGDDFLLEEVLGVRQADSASGSDPCPSDAVAFELLRTAAEVQGLPVDAEMALGVNISAEGRWGLNGFRVKSDGT